MWFEFFCGFMSGFVSCFSVLWLCAVLRSGKQVEIKKRGRSRLHNDDETIRESCVIVKKGG